MEQRLLYVAGELAEHSAADFRQLPRGIWRTSGVLGQDDLTVTPRGGGAAMSVDVTAGRAHIDGYLARNSATITNVDRTVIDPAPPSGNERIDSVQARIVDPGDGTGVWSVVVVKGNPAQTGTAVAPTIPGLAIELAHVRVPAGTASIQASNIIDRRVPASPTPYWPGDLPEHAQAGTLVTRSGGRAAVKGTSRWVEHWPNPDQQQRYTKADQTLTVGNDRQVGSVVDLDNTRHWKVKASWSGDVRKGAAGTGIVTFRLQAVSDLSVGKECESASFAADASISGQRHPNTQLVHTFAPAINLTRVRVLANVLNSDVVVLNSNLIVEAWPA